ncbi:MAG: hypothetical protein HC821_00030 [Lewinella sp.]|nr:hypothetical protein [Lewinella sp.]
MPLLNGEERVIGLLELASPVAYGINAFLELRFRAIVALFRTALARSREEVDNRLEAILREHYTSLHPSVEWRFLQSAYRLLENQEPAESTPEPVAFKHVYPLYGQADIVNSSTLRNAAIYADLRENLLLAKNTLEKALLQLDYPLAHQGLRSIEAALNIKQDDFNNSNETSAAELLLNNIHPILRQFADDVPALEAPIAHYFSRLDPDLMLIYHRRRDYEQSVSRLNTELSHFFLSRDRKSQNYLAHYFESYQTDGVEYQLYAGQSLLQKKCFSEIHLRNLRLAQLIDLCDATRLVAQLQSQLPHPLTTAQLAFAYTSPLNINFRMDEKRFDVEGAYNIRYEILKKRIDKATINQGQERLTKPEHLSIIYLHDKDQQEYLGYCHYLQTEGYLTDELEEFFLDPMQGVQGLRAIRAKVKSLHPLA